MAAEIFTAISALRMVLDSETDADSPDNETSYGALRVAIESLFLILLGTGVDGTVTTIAETVLTDTGGFVDSAHIDHTVLMTSGDAKGNTYTIDSNTTTALTFTGDTMVSDGVAIDDTYVILYDIKTNLDGHDHDAKNSANVVLADGSITEAKYGSGSVDQTALKTTLGTVTNATTSYEDETITGGTYCFFPQSKVTGGNLEIHMGEGTVSTGAAYVTRAATKCGTGSNTLTVNTRYVTASGELFWIFVKYDSLGNIATTSAASDHPCFGNNPYVEQPFNTRNPGDNIVVINPSFADTQKIELATIPTIDGGWMTEQKLRDGVGIDYRRPTRDFIEVFLDEYEVQQSQQTDWPDTQITVALPKIHNGELVSDWRFMPSGTKLTPIKAEILRPDYVTPLKYKRKPSGIIIP